MHGLATIPERDRPRERLLREGTSALSDRELIAVLLGCGGRGRDALAIASEILARFSSLRRLAAAGIGELCQVPGVGLAHASRVKAALALAARLSERPLDRGDALRGPRDVWERVGRRLTMLEHEVFVALALDTKHRVLAEHRMAEGGVCSVEILPRDVFARLVREAAAAAIFVHNHPSGDPTPSAADIELTRRLTEAGRLVGVQVLDHVIVAQNGAYSFAEGGRCAW